MSLTEEDRQIIQKTWAVVSKNPSQAGVELFRRFFEAYPDYIPLFPFRDVTNLNVLVRDKRLKAHATNVAYTLTMIVENVNEPEIFDEMVNRLAENHKPRAVSSSHFDHLKNVFQGMMLELLGPGVMNEVAVNAWEKMWDAMIEATNRVEAEE